MDDDIHLPLLGAISAFLLWMEQLIGLLSAPMLTAGLLIGLISLLSDGRLLLAAPGLLYAWAIALSIGVDGQLVGTWYRVSVVARDASLSWGRKSLKLTGLILLGVALAYVAYISALIFSMQQSYHLTIPQALAQMGMDSSTWLWERAGISVFLVCLSGASRYRKKPTDTRTPAEKEQDIRDQMRLEELQQQHRAQRLRGMIGAVHSAVSAATTDTPDSESAIAEESPDDTPRLQVVSGDDSEAAPEAAPVDEAPMPTGRYNARRVNARLEKTR